MSSIKNIIISQATYNDITDKSASGILSYLATQNLYDPSTQIPIVYLESTKKVLCNGTLYGEVNLDDIPTAGSENPVKSGGVYSTTPSIDDTDIDADLDFSDEDGNVVMRLSDGHIKTKYFDSDEVYNTVPTIDDTRANTDLDFSDEDGNVVMRLSDGHIITKNFNSSNIEDILSDNIFKNKRISFIGDSITTFANYPGSNSPFYTGQNAGITNVNQTWWGGLCKKCGATINRIYAYGGGDVVGRLCLQYDKLFSEGSTGTAPDYIFILGGINDWYHGRNLGTLEDNEASNTTFYAAYKYLIKNLKITYPNATIICLSMLNSMIFDNDNPPTNNNKISIRKFCEAVIECAKYYSVPYLDLNCLVNININNYTRILADKTHPNYIGAELVTDAIIRNVKC